MAPRAPWIGALAIFFLLPAIWAAPATAARWMCPDCPDSTVERADDAPTLACAACGMTYTSAELIPTIGYINSRTRDTEVAWAVEPIDCSIFRSDGMQAIDEKGTVWVPWSLVDWFIPRMRIVRLKNGRELATDYPMSDNACPKPPRFVFDVKDSTAFPGQPAYVFNDRKEESMAELFIVAFSPEGRDSARVRFIQEVEAGKQPRLPRTQPSVYHQPDVVVPASLAKPDLKAEAVVEVRVHEQRGVVAEKMIQSSGIPLLDQEAMQIGRSSSFVPGGEMGVATPAWVRLHFYFEGKSGRMVAETAPKSFWRR